MRNPRIRKIIFSRFLQSGRLDSSQTCLASVNHTVFPGHLFGVSLAWPLLIQKNEVWQVMGHRTASVSVGGEESTMWVERGQYLSVMKLSVHIDLSLCDEARQVWDWVGDICKEIHWSQCRQGLGLHPVRATWILFLSWG